MDLTVKSFEDDNFYRLRTETAAVYNEVFVNDATEAYMWAYKNNNFKDCRFIPNYVDRFPIDFCEWAKTLLVVGSTVGQPVAGFRIGCGDPRLIDPCEGRRFALRGCVGESSFRCQPDRQDEYACDLREHFLAAPHHQ